MFQLTKGGEPRATIVLGSRATWLDCHAAEELRSYKRTSRQRPQREDELER